MFPAVTIMTPARGPELPTSTVGGGPMAHRIELPATEPCLSVVHEGCGHLYDSLIELRYREGEPVSEETLEALEEVYVTVAEDDIDRVEIEFHIE